MRALLLPALLVLSACASTGGSTDPAPTVDLAAPGTILNYEVAAGTEAYPFSVAIVQNDDAGTVFDFDLDLGRAEGRVTMSPAARRAAARGMLNTFDAESYDLEDQTSVWMSRSDVARLMSGETVAINVDGRSATAFTLDDCIPMTVNVHGADVAVDACRYVGEGGRYIVALDDEMDPLILDMDAGPFSVTIQNATR